MNRIYGIGALLTLALQLHAAEIPIKQLLLQQTRTSDNQTTTNTKYTIKDLWQKTVSFLPEDMHADYSYEMDNALPFEIKYRIKLSNPDLEDWTKGYNEFAGKAFLNENLVGLTHAIESYQITEAQPTLDILKILLDDSQLEDHPGITDFKNTLLRDMHDDALLNPPHYPTIWREITNLLPKDICSCDEFRSEEHFFNQCYDVFCKQPPTDTKPDDELLLIDLVTVLQRKVADCYSYNNFEDCVAKSPLLIKFDPLFRKKYPVIKDLIETRKGLLHA